MENTIRSCTAALTLLEPSIRQEGDTDMTALNPVAGADGRIISQAWGGQSTWWSQQQRNRPLVWPAGEPWFVNDPLGEMPHTHPDASEVVFVAEGELLLTVGTTPLRMVTGDYCLIPPDTYHNPRNVSDVDAHVLVLVAPNWRSRPWKAEGFVESDYRLSAEVVQTDREGDLPSDELIVSRVDVLAPGETVEAKHRMHDLSLYVLDGVLEVAIGRMKGRVGPHNIVNVMAGSEHALLNVGDTPVRYLSMLAPMTPAPVVHD